MELPSAPLSHRARTSLTRSAAIPRMGACALLGLLTAGCAVPQPRGAGRLEHRVEPTVGRGYWLYLPRDYVEADERALRARRWPLIMTFHGMKPFDSAHAQACEWQQEADRYGFIVAAPELSAPDVLAEFPVRTVHPRFRSDEIATLAILDHVLQNTHADPGNLLATSFSSGGYLAHYMLNRHPERFTCLAVRQSNFSSSILDPALTARSRYHPVLIVNTENDFPLCITESRESVQWYQSHGYRNVAWLYLKHLWHERTPDLAADFFAHAAQVTPNGPPAALLSRSAIDGNAEGLGLLSGRLARFELPPTPQQPPALARGETPPRALPEESPWTLPRRESAPVRAIPQREPEPPPARPTPERSATPLRPERRLVSIRAAPRTGIEPVYVNFSAEVPADWQQRTQYHWTLNGEPIGSSVNGQKLLSQAGDYTLGLRVIAPDGQAHHAYLTIRVLARLGSAGYSAR